MPSLLQRAKRALARIAFSGAGGSNAPSPYSWYFNSLVAGTEHNYELEAGDLWRNSAVMATLAWITRAFPEAQMEVQREGKKGVEKVVGHRIHQLLETPNPFYGGEELQAATLLSYHLDGNAYWIKVRNGLRELMEMWWVPWWQMEPQWDEKGAAFITHYRYTINGRDYTYPVEDVVHFRHGIDPHNYRKGLAPIKAALREIASDNLASQFGAAMLRNMGVPGVIISPKDESALIDDVEAQALKAKFSEHFTGENRGKPLINTIPLEVAVPAFSPDKLALDKLRNTPEERITALFGVPAVVVGLGSGLERSTFSNVRQMRQAAYENCLVPNQRDFAKTLTRQVLPEIGAEGEKVAWNYDEVPAFADHRQSRAEEIALLWQAGLVKRRYANERLKLPTGDGDDVYFYEVMPQGGMMQAPEDTPRRPKPSSPAKKDDPA